MSAEKPTLCAGSAGSFSVTKGSFYWHFENRADFLQALLDYWVAVFNRRVPETAEAGGGSALERLRRVFEMVVENDLGIYDVAFDAWAAHEPEIAEQVKATYRYRYQYVRSLFHELGFRGIELETRTTAFLSFLKSESWVTGRERPASTPRRIDAGLEFFTGRGD